MRNPDDEIRQAEALIRAGAPNEAELLLWWADWHAERRLAVKDERLRKSEWEVRDINIDAARRMVSQYHYAKGASNTATYLHGLFRAGDIFQEQCVGVAWWIPPTKSAALATYPERWTGVLSLSRLVIMPDVPANACTFLLSRSRRLISVEDWPCLLTYADDWRGHTGAIYRADNWTYVGKTKPERCYCIDGRMVARKAGPNTRTHADMLAIGAEMVGSFSKHKYIMVRNTSRMCHNRPVIDTPARRSGSGVARKAAPLGRSLNA